LQHFTLQHFGALQHFTLQHLGALQHLVLQHFCLQQGAGQQLGAASQQGAAGAAQQGAGAAQVGSQAGAAQQAAGAAHVGSQQVGLQHFTLQHFGGLQHLTLQHFTLQHFCLQQVGAQHAGAHDDSQPQLGSKALTVEATKNRPAINIAEKARTMEILPKQKELHLFRQDHRPRAALAARSGSHGSDVWRTCWNRHSSSCHLPHRLPKPKTFSVP